MNLKVLYSNNVKFQIKHSNLVTLLINVKKR